MLTWVANRVSRICSMVGPGAGGATVMGYYHAPYLVLLQNGNQQQGPNVMSLQGFYQAGGAVVRRQSECLLWRVLRPGGSGLCYGAESRVLDRIWLTKRDIPCYGDSVATSFSAVAPKLQNHHPVYV